MTSKVMPVEVPMPISTGKTKNKALKILNYYSWLLYPLTVNLKDGSRTISASPLVTLAKMSLSTLLFMVGPGFLWYLIKDDPSTAWNKMQANISTYTGYALTGQMVTLLLALVVSYVLCHIQSVRLNKVLEIIGGIERRFGLQELGQEQFKLGKYYKFFVGYAFLFVSLFASLCVNMQFHYNEIKDLKEDYDQNHTGFDWCEIALCSLWALSTSWGFYNPVYLGTGAVMSYYLEAIKEVYRHIVDNLKNKDQRNVASSIKLGFEVTQLLESVNMALAPFYVIVYFLELVMLTVSTYAFFDIAPRSNNLKWIFGVTMSPVMQMLASVFGLCLFSILGQSLEDERKRCKGALEMTAAKFTKKQERIHGKKVAMLLRQLDRPEVLSPYGMFNVNNSSAVSTIATTITYIIVLLQFKQSEEVPSAVQVTGEIEEGSGESPTDTGGFDLYA